MTVADAAVKGESGCYDLRGPDFETLLVGPITGTIIDADRMVRTEWRNGFPNWALYRCALAGDTHLRSMLRQWCVAFAVACGTEGGVSRKTYSDELAAFAGWDAYAVLMTTHWTATAEDVAAALKIAPATYRKFRNAVARRLKASLDEYWVRMQIAMRQVSLVERRQAQAVPQARLSDGRGFGDIDVAGDGCFRAMPRGSGS